MAHTPAAKVAAIPSHGSFPPYGTGGLVAGGLLFFALGVVLARMGQRKLDG